MELIVEEKVSIVLLEVFEVVHVGRVIVTQASVPSS